jgi:hypothetical protein
LASKRRKQEADMNGILSNVCHGSDSVENAKKEIALWFKPEEVLSWKSAQHDWVYEK